MLLSLPADTVYHSNNSSCDSDSLQQDGYHSNSREPKKLGDIPAHVNESISISDMDRDTTDIEVRVFSGVFLLEYTINMKVSTVELGS